MSSAFSLPSGDFDRWMSAGLGLESGSGEVAEGGEAGSAVSPEASLSPSKALWLSQPRVIP